MNFGNILEKYRSISFNERDKGARFERLMRGFLLTDPLYEHQFQEVWLWNDFPFKNQFGGTDLGIDLVGFTNDGLYWAIQCKCYQETSVLDKSSVDSFLSTSSRSFRDDEGTLHHFGLRLWISTTNKWGPNAEESLHNQNPQVVRINLHNLQESNVDWEKLENDIHGVHARIGGRKLMPHQQEAMEATHNHFKHDNRGKLIMACGTGKTFCALKIAENETDGNGVVLFLVPSIALLGQTLREWSSFSDKEINPICICSDPEISRSKKKNEDGEGYSVIDLAYPASTNVNEILQQFKKIKPNQNSLTVVFSTYQSIDVIAKVQKKLQEENVASADFELIICDEAHRTTGVTLSGDDESSFTKVHDNDFLKAKKRLYMTATPRLFSDDIKSQAAKVDAVLCSMDDEKLYGKEIYRIGFGEAVEKNLLTDYKVLILTLSDKNVPPAVQKMIADKESEINTDDASKLIGCINALSKQILGDNGLIKDSDPEPMRRAVAFCQNIPTSKKITSIFNTATQAYIDSLPADHIDKMVSIDSKHIDGTMPAPRRDEMLSWLKGSSAENQCRVLTNVKVLSEGVDVPSLDAVLFLSARNSQVDVVQSVGRVMRRAPNKKYGYIIIPVVVPSEVDASSALDDNVRFKVVWTVLNALRAHDDRFNATINKIELNKNRPGNVLVGGSNYQWDNSGAGSVVLEDEQPYTNSKDIAQQLALQFEQLQNVVYARLVEKVGDRRYWEQWAKNVADIAERSMDRIKRLVSDNGKHQDAFRDFISGLRKNINPSISEHEAIEMLSQHIITKPVFEALFEGYSFVKENPISVSMQKMLDLLEEQAIEKDTETLDKFYESVKTRAQGIDNAEGKQKIIIELYDKFFKSAFPKMVEKLGIVYTPVECVDYIIHSVNDVLKKEFGRGLTDENIHILDPFTGTGTFITRLLQSGLIETKDLERKYKHEIHANEIVLLAYYIAAINIENAYHDATPDPDDGIGKTNYTPFDGIVLTDTFQLGETEDGEKLFSDMFPQNSTRVQRQKKAPLRIIIGNPPYSIGQKSANDNAQNQEYPKLDQRIANTYAKLSSAGLNKSLYDAYIKAFRWSTDRLNKDNPNGGIICFISNGAWLDGNSTDGFRKSIEKEFSSIYVFNLRGNQRTSGELSRKEGGKIFGSGSRTPIAITLLVKNPNNSSDKAKIYYHDIGDYLDREQKLKIIRNFKTFSNEIIELKELEPNEHGDWISMRNNSFDDFIPLEPDKNNRNLSLAFFISSSSGLATSRDAWCYNYSSKSVANNISKSLSFFNSQSDGFKNAKLNQPNIKVEDYIDLDSTKISWDRQQKKDIDKNKKYSFEINSITIGLYRPFQVQWVYFNRQFNNCVYQLPKIFPNNILDNKIIIVTGVGAGKPFSVLLTDKLPNYHTLDTDVCFPFYYYEEVNINQKGLFDTDETQKYIRRDAISNFISERAHQQYGKNITKEDIFYYVYGFLHSPEYRMTFANDLKKMLPRLPLVDDVKDFWAFSKAGRQLADLHLNYKSVPAHPGVIVDGNDCGFYEVQKMRFPSKEDKSTILYNSRIRVSNIPLEAYEYVVNGKSAIEWIMERYQITTHKESGIVNDPNDWSREHNKPRYILDLLLSIVNVSVQTVEIVKSLPKLKFE
jgi:predicted helicase